MKEQFILTLKKMHHFVFGCPNDNLVYKNKSYAVCEICGRKHFIFRSY